MIKQKWQMTIDWPSSSSTLPLSKATPTTHSSTDEQLSPGISIEWYVKTYRDKWTFYFAFLLSQVIHFKNKRNTFAEMSQKYRFDPAKLCSMWYIPIFGNFQKNIENWIFCCCKSKHLKGQLWPCVSDVFIYFCPAPLPGQLWPRVIGPAQAVSWPEDPA